MKFLARKAAKPCLPQAGAKNPSLRTSPPLWTPKNPPRRTSQRVFSVIICVKRIPRFRGTGSRAPRHTGAITTQQQSILQLFCIAPEILRDRRLRGSDYQPPPHNPRFYRGSSMYRSFKSTIPIPSKTKKGKRISLFYLCSSNYSFMISHFFTTNQRK